MRLPENLRESLKRPLGLLLKDSKVTKENILKNIPKEAFLITVGDATTEKMIKLGLDPSIQIVDSVEKRRKRDLPEGRVQTTLHCNNPAAEITEESITVIKKGFKEVVPVRIIVNGEEDLLVLPVVVYAPENSVVMYGQPNEGLVIVAINQKIKDNAKKIMALMA
ncbi:MAG: GTP-dependent dephospho-CoA kinase family protein [Thaumarchaeota archaeon]|nr:GTP-dependent dephospho-CoA kinase family protein [Nitrososphaerota archaeon]